MIRRLVLHPAEKALAQSAFFVVLALLWATPASALCPADRIDESAVVRHVYDGDTVELADGRRLRLIGINTPEIGRDGRADEAHAKAARRQLRDLIGDAGQRLALRHGDEPKDRYGRLLAQAYLSDGRNVGALLVAAGLAHAIAVPPNLAGLDCLRAAERAPRASRRGIWSVARFSGESSDDLSRPLSGFRVVEGRVLRVGQSRRSIWLNLPGRFAVRVARKDLLYFRQPSPEALAGRNIRVRGWVRRDGGETRMQLRHPLMLEILD